MHQSQHRAGMLGQLPTLLLRYSLLGVCLCGFLAPLAAQDVFHGKYKFQERYNERRMKDRKEGLQHAEPISGEQLELVAAFYRASLPESGAIQYYHLGFWLPQNEPQVFIKVRDDDVFKQQRLRYFMQPIAIQFSKGFQEFFWDARLIQDLNIPLDKLHAIAKIGGRGRDVITPVLLHAGPFPLMLSVQGCRFVFRPSHTMQVSSQVSLMGHTPRLIAQEAAQSWTADNTREFVWNGKDLQGQAPPAGQYQLELTALVMPPGQPVTQLSFFYEFFYAPVLVK